MSFMLCIPIGMKISVKKKQYTLCFFIKLFCLWVDGSLGKHNVHLNAYNDLYEFRKRDQRYLTVI